MARVRGKADYKGLTGRDRVEYARVLNAASQARTHNLTARTATRRAHTSVDTVRKWAPELLTKDAFGRLAFTPADRLYRPPISVIERGGEPRTVHTRGYYKARLASDYAHTLDRYRAGLVGPEAFGRFEGKRIGGVELEADPDRIEELDATGRLDDFEFYEDLP